MERQKIYSRLELMITILTIYALVACSILFFQIRNNWVFKTRKNMIDDDFQKYKTLVDYNTMLFRFWIWDVEKFVKK